MSVRYDAGVSTAYGAAVDAGYTGTYEDFCRLLVNLVNIEAEATTLPEGSEATASYADGVLSFGIPRGNTGATGAQGEKGEKGDTGATGNGIANIELTSTQGAVKTYTITYTNGTTTTFDVTDGEITKAILANNLAPEYDPASTYETGAYCSRDGQIHRCIVPITTAEAWTAAHWTAVALGEDVDDLRSVFDTLGLSVIDGKINMTYEEVVA